MNACVEQMSTRAAHEPWQSGPTASACAEPLSFTLPPSLEAHEPPEARGLRRDEVRLMVSFLDHDEIAHTQFTHFPEFLQKGDVLVVNESATINAALNATRADGEPIELHLSQRLADDRWVVELRRSSARGTAPLLSAEVGERIALAAGGTVELIAHYRPRRYDPRRDGARRSDDATPDRTGDIHDDGTRLWLASVNVGGDLLRYLDQHGFPIRYGYVPEVWPLSYYQTIFAREPGSAEMPSAGRAFTPRIMQALAASGVSIAPILLHTGVASLEEHEPPYPEFFRVGARTAHTVNEARRGGGRVVAIGTTAVRAIETVAANDGTVTPGEGWTDVVITPARGMSVVDGLLTGFHEPRASHLAMLEALAGRHHLEVAYRAALRERYLWHEFGDLHLLMPARLTTI